MSYIIIHSEVLSGNRVVQPFLSVSLCLASSFPPPIPSSGGMCRDWWQITPNCFRELSIHNQEIGLFSSAYSILDQTGQLCPVHLLSLTIKWWLILAHISIQLQYPFDFDAIDS